MQIQLNEFINYIRSEKNYSEHTIKNYKFDIEQFAKEVNIQSLTEISKSKIREFLSILADPQGDYKLAASSRNRKLAAIRSFCKFLVEERYIETNPSIEISTAKTDERLPVTFSVEEVSNVIDSAEDERDNAILETLYAIGVRVDELVNSRISDIDFNNARIKVFGKGGKERILPMNGPSISKIVKYIKSRNIVSEWLIPSPMNPSKPITDRTIRNIVYKYAKVNGLSDMSPHKFRHSCATHMHQNGMDIRDIQVFLGHADISTTTIYTKVALNSLTKSYQSAHPRG